MRLLVVVTVLLAACGERSAPPVAARAGAFRSSAEPLHISMDELHQSGGVPPGWRFALPDGDAAAGRRTFVALGCHSCHAVKGEAFPSSTEPHPGPDLTGMGSHHPAGYFAESIVNPDAVVVDGPDWATEDGHSRMPAYPDLTLVQLVDLVAYLRTLTDESGPFRDPAAMPATLSPRPPPPAGEAHVFFVQSYDVNTGQLEAFERWFAAEALPALRAADGFVAAETHVDNTRPGPALVTVLAFRDDGALRRFLTEATGAAVKQKFDSFIGPHGHQMFRTAPLYRVDELSGR